MKTSKRRNTIRWSIFRQHAATTTLTLLIMLFLVAFALVRFYLQWEDASQQRESELISSNINLVIEKVSEKAVNISANPQLQDNLIAYYGLDKSSRATLQVSTSRQLFDALGLDQNISYCYIIDTDGNPITSTIHVSFLQSILEDPGLYYQFSQKIRTQVLGPIPLHAYDQSPTSINLLLFSKTILQLGTNRRLGTLLVFMDETQLRKTYSQNAPHDGTQIFIADSTGNIVSSTQEDAIYQNYAQYLSPRKSIWGLTAFPAGQRSLLFETSLDEHGWTLYRTVPIETVTRQIWILLAITLLISLFAIGMILVRSLRQSRILTSPIVKLTNVMNTITAGNKRVRADIEGTEEIDILCNGFNQLMDTQEQLLQDIQNAQELNSHYRFRLFQEQIKPHFLYNSLESILSLVQLDMTQEAEDALFQLSDFYRLSLSSGADIIPLEHELRLTEDYLAIQKTRYVEFFDYSITVDCPLENYQIPKLTLQPLVENAIYHGIKPKDDFGHIDIRVTQQDEQVFIIVEDNGVGMTQEKINSLLYSNHSSEEQNFGIASIMARMHYTLNAPDSLFIESQPGKFTRVTIWLTPKEEL